MGEDLRLEDDFRLGDALVRPRDRQFEVEGEVRGIDHKAFQVLTCLVHRAGTVVSKKELLERVWEQEFVSDEVLTVAVSRLRRVLGDQARAPRFIETVPQVGYRLIAEVKPREESQEPPPQTLAQPTRTARNELSVGRLLALVTLLAVCVLFFFLWPRYEDQGGEVHTLAVLPLENLTGEEGQEYLAQGMTEALITGLARQQGLRVVSQAAVRRYQEARPPLVDIARQLRVDAVVEGSVQRAGDLLRVSVRLMDVAREDYLWAETVDGELKDILGLQEQLVANITGKLLPAQDLANTSQASTNQEAAVSPEAYEHYLRGRYLLGLKELSTSTGNLEKAVQEFERALAMAPEFAAVHGGLAEAYLALGERTLIPPGEAFPRVRQAAEKAMALGQQPAKARALQAMVLFLYDWDFVAAEEGFLGALELDPNEILARDGYSRYLTAQGRFEEALVQQRELQELNPLIYHRPHLAYIYNMAREHDRALEELHGQLEIERRSARLYAHLTSTWRWLGQPLAGRDSFQESLRLRGVGRQQMEELDNAFVDSGVTGVAWLLVEHLRTVEASGAYVPAMAHAEVLTLAGDSEGALAQLEKALEQREPDLLLLAQSPDYDVLRETPRFQEILRRVGLPSKE